MRAILLILIGFSSFVDASDFSRANGVVNDARTNLEWQDDYSDNNNAIKNDTWQGAIDYCENLSLDGKSDWRLPNLNELTSLVDDTKDNPSIDVIFQKTNSNTYWSSTSYSNGTEVACVVYFYSGSHGSVAKSHNVYVRCVRAGQ